MIFSTERLQVRAFRLEDAPVFARYRSDPDVARYQGWEAPVPLDEAERTVRSFAAGDPEQPGWYQYAIDLDGVLIGDIGVNLADNLRQAELGFTLAPEYQSKGYATEALRGMVGHLFGNRRLHRLGAECDARNTPSARLLERVGFRREGLRRQASWIKGEWTDDLLFGLLRTD